MKALKFSALAILMAGMPVAAQAGGGSHSGGMRSGSHMSAGMPRMGGQHMGGVRNWGGKHQGRWVGGWRAPGGWGAYRRPYVGYVLPRYWINPTYYIGNYGSYGFAQPSYGYGWSRYYDDAVMTDRYGRVQDYVQGVQWGDDDYGYDQGYDAGQGGYGYQGAYQGGYDDRYARPKDRDGGMGGALIGGAVGALGGGLIAKRGDNTEGAIIGGVVGAIAGAAIDAGDNTGRGYKTRKRYSGRDMDYGRGDYGRGPAPMGYDYGYGGSADGVTYNGHWAGTWTGSFDGGPTRTWSGTFNGDYRGQRAAPVAVAPQAPQGGHWGGGHHGGTMMQHQGMWQGGYGGGETTVTVHSQPVVTTTTEIIEETVYVSRPVVRKRYAPKRIVRAKPKPRCVCKVVYR